MLPTIRKELGDLSMSFYSDLENFIGEANDELTRSNIVETTITYLIKVRQLVPIDFDLNKIGICPLASAPDRIDFNLYTKRLLDDIIQNVHIK